VSVPTALDAAVDRLDDALGAAGFPGLSAPRDSSSLEGIAEAVAPFELPPDVRRFWERVDPTSISVSSYPMLVDPHTALEIRRADIDAGASLPLLLLPIAYSSHVHDSVELVSEWAVGGTVFRWAWDEEAFQIAYRSIVDLIDVIRELVEEGALERGEGWAHLSSEAEEEKRLGRLRTADRIAAYRETAEIPMRIEAWPEHWLAANGIDLQDRMPLGATHTIQELVAAAEKGPAEGRIAGTVVRLVGSARGALVLVEDETGSLEVWCPTESPWRPVHRRRFEFEVTLAGPPSSAFEHAAVAAAIRPVDEAG
jgi:hypothetical protein